jgi:1-acyl-sn-glycerol-3-phosphate acyltransferase
VLFKKLLLSIFNFLFTLFWYVHFIFQHVWGIPFGIIALFFGKREFVNKATVWWTRNFFAFGGQKLHITGMEHITNDSKYLFIMNHSSFFDIHAVMNIKPDMIWMAKKELLNMPLIGAGLRASGGIPIDRVNFAASMENLHKVVQEAKPGFALGVFPEGTRTKNGKLQNFKRGFVRILRNSGLRIIPVTLNGFF